MNVTVRSLWSVPAGISDRLGQDCRSFRGIYGLFADCPGGDRDDHPSDFASTLTTQRVVEATLQSAANDRAVADVA